MFSTRRDIRLKLGSRLLVVLESHASDETGRIVASHLTPLVVRVANRRRDGLHLLEGIGPLLCDQARTDWITDTLALHAALWSTRRQREVAIARTREQRDHPSLQLGLFDLRALHQRLDSERSLEDTRFENRLHVSAAIDSSALTVHDPRPVLILATWH
jgi:hypothetical protein